MRWLSIVTRLLVTFSGASGAGPSGTRTRGGAVKTNDGFAIAKASVANLAEDWVPKEPAAVSQMDQGRSVLREELLKHGVNLGNEAERQAAAIGAILLGHLLLGNVPMTPPVAQLIVAEMALFVGVADSD